MPLFPPPSRSSSPPASRASRKLSRRNRSWTVRSTRPFCPSCPSLPTARASRGRRARPRTSRIRSSITRRSNSRTITSPRATMFSVTRRTFPSSRISSRRSARRIRSRSPARWSAPTGGCQGRGRVQEGARDCGGYPLLAQGLRGHGDQPRGRHPRSRQPRRRGQRGQGRDRLRARPLRRHGLRPSRLLPEGRRFGRGDRSGGEGHQGALEITDVAELAAIIDKLNARKAELAGSITVASAAVNAGRKSDEGAEQAAKAA